jgi:hypothetical protein
MNDPASVDRLAARVGSVVVGIMALEGAVFAQIIPIAVAGALAAWDSVALGRGPAAWLVRRFGVPPREWITAGEVRVGQGIVASLCLASVVLQAADVHPVSWALGALAGVVAVAGAIAGRPSLGLGRHNDHDAGPPVA